MIAELEEESRRLRCVEEGIRRAAGKRLEGGSADDGAMET